MIEAEGVLITTMSERVAMRQALIGSKSGLIEALQSQQTTLMQQKGQMSEADIVVSTRDVDRVNRNLLADNAKKLVEV